MKSIPHISQSQLKQYAKLAQKKYRQSQKQFLIEGSRLVGEALDSGWEVEALLVSGETPGSGRGMLRSGKVPVFEISGKELAKLSDTVTSQGIIGVVNVKDAREEDLWMLPPGSLVVALDRVSDPGNVGTIIRTCDWFGADAVVLDRDTVEFTNPKLTRSTMGSMFHLPVYSDVDLPDIIAKAKKKGFTVYATTLAESKSIPKKFAGKSIIILGSEAHGVRPELLRQADELLSIPKFGKAESLNVAISCGVILGSWRLSS